MFCEAYHCKMSELACIARQKNAVMTRGDANRYRPGQCDPRCRDCEQGRAVAAKAAGETPQSDVRASTATAVCADIDCHAKGAPQPIADFDIHPPSGKRFRYCHQCLVRRRLAGRKAAKPGPSKKQAEPKKPSARQQRRAEVIPIEETAAYLQTIIDKSTRREITHGVVVYRDAGGGVRVRSIGTERGHTTYLLGLLARAAVALHEAGDA